MNLTFVFFPIGGNLPHTQKARLFTCRADLNVLTVVLLFYLISVASKGFSCVPLVPPLEGVLDMSSVLSALSRVDDFFLFEGCQAFAPSGTKEGYSDVGSLCKRVLMCGVVYFPTPPH